MMSRLRWLAAMLVRGPDAEFITQDLDDLYARDRARGMSVWRAHQRYVGYLFDSALCVWRADLRWPPRPDAEWRSNMRGGSMLQDLRFALRLFRKHPAPAGIVIGGLALAIGVATAVFSIVNATMLRPYGMDDPVSVVKVMKPMHGHAWPYWSYAQFLRMREGTTLGRVEASLLEEARLTVAPASDDVANRWMLLVSGGYLNMLGARPALGRAIEPADDTPGAPPVIVASHLFWKTVLHGDPAAIGTRLWVNGSAATLVGVLRPDFTGPVDFDLRPAAWAPIAAFDDLQMGLAPTATSGPQVEVLARLTPGAAAPALEENLAAIVTRSRPPNSEPTEEGEGPAVRLFSAASPIGGPGEADVYTVLASVLGIVGLVLALACANAANLLMAAALTRAREIGVRLAMGASRRRIVRQLVNESLLLGAIAGACGFVLAIWLVPAFRSIVSMPPELDVALDGRVLLFAVAVALVCGLGAGLSPARYGARGNVLAALQSQSGAHRAGTAVAPTRLRASFVGFQAAVSMLLLACAALFARTAVTMTRVEIGFDADRLLAVSPYPQRQGLDQVAYVRAALAALRHVPWVEHAAIVRHTPFTSMESQRVTRGDASYRMSVIRSDGGYFAAVGVRILRGRAFSVDEAVNEAPVVLVSNGAARQMFGASDPIGQVVTSPARSADRRPEPATIIGVVSDAMLTRLDRTTVGTIYRPLSERSSAGSFTDDGLPMPPHLIVRTSSPGRALQAIEDALRRVDPTVRPVTSLVRERVDAYLAGPRTLVLVFGPPALLALLLAVLGVYGVTAFAAGQRKAEISVRMALGASSRDILRLLVADGLRPVLLGLAVGLALALAFGRVASQSLVGISPYDPLALGAALITLLGCALIAVVAPARRAANADPAGLLRAPCD
jgi:predicted permease